MEIILRVKKEHIVLLIAIFEGYEHITSIGTLSVDKLYGKVLIQIALGCEDMVKTILNSLIGEIEYEYWED